MSRIIKHLATVCACKIKGYVPLIGKLVFFRNCKMIHILKNCFKIKLCIIRTCLLIHFIYLYNKDCVEFSWTQKCREWKKSKNL